MKRKIFVFIGAPASGKGTRIEKCIGYKSISTSQMLRNAGYDLTKGTLIKDEVVNELIIRKIKELRGQSIILDGFPRTEEQLLALIKNDILIDRVFYIKAPKEILLERAKDRLTCIKCQASFTKSDFKKPKNTGICDHCGGKLIERLDDNIALFEKRLSIFEEKTKPIISNFERFGIPIIDIDSRLPPEDILKYI